MPLFLVLCLMLSASILRGQTIYIGPNNGDWSTAANWSNGLPAVGNEPTIVGSTVVCINGSLTINYAVTNFGSIINKGTTTLSGSINSGGALENQGTLTISSGATMTSSGGFTNSGTLTNNGNVNSNSPLANMVTGVFNNHAIWSQLGTATNDGIISNKLGANFSCPATLTNNKTIENLTGATWKIDFGGSFTNAVGSTLTNGGNFQNLGTFTNNTTVTNSGTFTNNGVHTCNGIFNNESGGRLESSATVNVAGRINNKLGGTIISSFKFNVLATGYVSNLAQFTNANMIDIADGGVFCVETLSTLTGQFGSAITNNGYFKIAASGTATTNGSITNTNRFDVYGTYDAMGGGQIINTDSICNYGLIKNVNVINNSAVWKNFGTTENNSGGVWTNTGRIENQKGAFISNNYEIHNKPSGIILNNGTFNNIIRVFNEGLITNNAYFIAAGDVINKVGGILTNTEVFVVREGSIQNEGTVNNQKTMINETCSIISNKVGGVINNTGRFENKGIIFQRGTVTGNAILALSGHIQGAGSNAPSICQTSLSSGTDALGEAKVYGQSGFKTGIGIDECAGFQYFANDVNRYVYHCNQIGQSLSTNFKIITRTGDSLTCTVPTTVFDNVAPVVSNCPTDVSIYTTGNTAVHTWPPVSGVDNCNDVPTVVETHTSGTAFPIGTTQVTSSVRDSRNNTTDCIFKVNVIKVFSTVTCPTSDAVAPVFANCPASQTITTNGSSAVAVWTTPSVSDNCYPVTVRQNLNSGTTFPSGTNTVIYTATDPSGNVGTCSFNITVNGASDPCATDNIKPVLVNCPANFFGTENTAINGAVGYWALPTATDNCGAVTLTGTAVSGSIFNVGTTNVVYTATDAKGNSATCSFTVTVAAANPCPGDVTGPVLTCPANVSVSTSGTSATATWTTPTATDACSPVVLNGSHQSGNTFKLGTTTVTYSASDKVGNTSKCTFNVTVNNPCLNDTQAPTLTACPANQTINSTNGSSATATWTAPTATDNCTLAGVTSNYASGAAFGIGTTNVIYTATDVSGNTSTCSFGITVNVGNVATCAGNIVLNQSFESNFANWTNGGAGTTIVNDANSGAQAVSICGDNQILKSQPYAIIGGTYTLSVRAKTSATSSSAFVGIDFLDASGTVISTARVLRGVTTTAYATYSMTATAPANAVNIIVFAYKTGVPCLIVDDYCLTNPCTNDTQAPTFSNCPANQTINVSGTATTGVATWTAPVASDNCGTPAVVNNFPSGTAFPIGTTTVTYVATDAKGLKSTCSFTITVVNPCASDVTPPSFGTTCPTNKSAVSTNGLCVPVNFTAPTATDNCGTPSVSGTHATNFCFPVGTTTVTYTAVDAKNNKATCSFTVTITNDPCATDVTKPTLTACPANQSLTTTNNACKAATWTAPTATDNCGTPTVTSTHTSGFCFPVGTTTVTYTATDAKNNTSTCSFTVTVTNTVTCPALSTTKTYRFVNKLSGKVLGLEALNTNVNTYVNQYTYNTTPNMQWQLSLNSDGSYKIINQYSKDILACHYSTNGSRTYQWDNINDNAKYWRIVNMGNCEYRIQNVYSGKYLDNINGGTAEGGYIGVWSATGGSDQLWRIEEVTPAPNCFSNGNIAVDRWYSMNWNFPITLPTTSPNITNYQGNTQGPWNIGDNYTSRVRGYICPQQTGTYQFNVTGDDNLEFFLSTSSLSGDMSRRAYINGWTSELEYTKYASQTSPTITLQANQLYYFEIRHTEGGGGDGWRLSWKTPSNATWQPIQSQFLARSCNTTYLAASQAIFDFSAKADNKVAKLQWISNGGLNNDYFTVEKADDTGAFQKLGTVNASTGNDAPTLFDFVDSNPLEGDNHYRIKTVDFDGIERLSAVKTVNFSNLSDANVYPNPADDVLNIDLKAYEGRAVGIQVYNAMGKLITVTQVDKASALPIQVSTSEMPVGSYLIRLLPEGKREVTKQVKIAR
ncbi:MAG: HYR domain-containing protein [Saprospiraceae bacterium]|nr:HYR domain-containing protein [Saprospiraceae bacterium]